MNRVVKRLLRAVVSPAIRKLGPYGIWRLYRVAADADPACIRNGLQYILREELPHAALDIDFARFYAQEINPLSRAVWPLDTADAELGRRLKEIPSEATYCERLLLYSFFRNVWSGCKHVYEIGPFLGGTTRAIALGMLANPARDRSCRLHTCDRFRDYYTQDALKELTQPLVERAVLKKNILEEIGSEASFLTIFEAIHRSQDYFPLLAIDDKGIPDLPSQGVIGFMRLPAETEFDAFFVDGCKSWYGTKYFMKETCRRARPGSFYLFQDYGHWTCYWIASFLYLFREYFTPVVYVDDTYVFQLRQPLAEDQIEARYPDSPTGLGLPVFKRMFNELSEIARMRGDRRGAVGHQLHLAAALTVLDRRAEAETLVRRLIRLSSSVGYEKRIESATAFLTYYPVMKDGKLAYDSVKIANPMQP